MTEPRPAAWVMEYLGLRPEGPLQPNPKPMPQSLSNILLHLVFSTKKRERWFQGVMAGEMHRYLAGVLGNLECPAIIVGGAEDHVHILFRLSRTKVLAKTVETLKTSSSKWIKTKGAEYDPFHWQSGYGVFSVSQSEADTVIAYIKKQPEHHRKMTFQEEYKRLLERHQITFDPRYVWD